MGDCDQVTDAALQLRYQKETTAGRYQMNTNMGPLDRVIRVILGAALLWFALFAAPMGYNWLGWIGVVPLLTALVGICPLYSILGVNPCPAKRA
jgi:hypothetical protein